MSIQQIRTWVKSSGGSSAVTHLSLPPLIQMVAKNENYFNGIPNWITDKCERCRLIILLDIKDMVEKGMTYHLLEL